MKKVALFGLFFALILWIAYVWITKPAPFYSLDEKHIDHHLTVAQAHTLLGFDLVDPEQAPPDIKDNVMRGYRLVMDTPLYAPNYAKDQLSCTSCHFGGGDTLGGKNNGISLVGVTTHYPTFSRRDGKVITLADRINNCFKRSLSGNPLPEDSQEMQDIIAYLKWISKEVEHLPHVPWLGLIPLKSNHQPDPENGKLVYQTYCAMCHKIDGRGGGILDPIEKKTIPPLWGPNSFNDGAGMSNLSTLASFVYWNMPYQDASLTEEQALDVAAFVLQQPRPHFNEKE